MRRYPRGAEAALTPPTFPIQVLNRMALTRPRRNAGVFAQSPMSSDCPPVRRVWIGRAVVRLSAGRGLDDGARGFIGCSNQARRRSHLCSLSNGGRRASLLSVEWRSEINPLVGDGRTNCLHADEGSEEGAKGHDSFSWPRGGPRFVPRRCAAPHHHANQWCRYSVSMHSMIVGLACSARGDSLTYCAIWLVIASDLEKRLMLVGS